MKQVDGVTPFRFQAWVGLVSATVLTLATVLLVIFEDLMVGIGVGVVLGSLIFMHRMANVVTVEAGMDPALVDDDDASEPAEVEKGRNGNGDTFRYRAAVALRAMIDKAIRHDARVEILGATTPVRRILGHEGIDERLVRFRDA